MGCWEILRCLEGGGEPQSFGLAEDIGGFLPLFFPFPGGEKDGFEQPNCSPRIRYINEVSDQPAASPARRLQVAIFHLCFKF